MVAGGDMNTDHAVYKEAAELLQGLTGRNTGSGASVEDVERVAAAFVPGFLDVLAVLRTERRDMQPLLALNILPIQHDGFGNIYCLRALANGFLSSCGMSQADSTGYCCSISLARGRNLTIMV